MPTLTFFRDASRASGLLEFCSLKCRSVARSALSDELIAFAEASDCYVLAYDLSAILVTKIPLHMYIDSKGLFDVMTCGQMTVERRLQSDIEFACDGFDDDRSPTMPLSRRNGTSRMA
jgi:hypothetical protein